MHKKFINMHRFFSSKLHIPTLRFVMDFSMINFADY